MKLLAIFSNSALLKTGAQNAYGFLAEKRKRLAQYAHLDREYEQNKFKGPLLLEQVFDVAAKGMEEPDFLHYCNDYFEINKRENIDDQLKKLQKRFSKIVIFTAYPSAIYTELLMKGLVSAVYGAEHELSGFEVSGMKPFVYNDEDAVKEVFTPLEGLHNFTHEPNRYGMLAKLIDIMKENGLKVQDVVIVGEGVTAHPSYPLSGKQVARLEDLR
ncbi:hypothetical protein H6758_04060 [Candidatus Nomurabacteria bacterium]|nr:hypothetical protein [Candidatus Nomurabacteria bacterium]